MPFKPHLSERPAWKTVLFLAGMAVLSLVPAHAQQTPDPGSQNTSTTPEDKTAREGELKALEQSMAVSDESRRKLEAEANGIKEDRAKLNTALIETADRIRSAEEHIQTLEQRLETLTSSEAAIRQSLESRKDVIVEVFAALQRMGHRPPPAVLVRPEDMLEAVRASILLGSVLPELRGEAETLASDLSELVRLKTAIATDRDTLASELTALNGEQNRLQALVDARQSRIAQIEQNLGTEREKAAALAQQAGTLKELIDRMETELSGSRQAADEAQKAADAQALATRERFAQAAFRDPARLAPKIPFTEARGMLPRPVVGEVSQGFGATDTYGGTTRGISIATRPKATVVSPSDGWIAFAGPFRSYGRLLIINAGGGYYLLLAGMEQINVEVGQFVLAGEPVANMGQTSLTSPATGALETNDPVLYVEFRKDGTSIDPSPWWAKSQSEKVRG